MIDWLNGALATLAASISVDNVGGLVAIFFLTVSADIGIPFPFLLDTILFFTTYKTGGLLIACAPSHYYAIRWQPAGNEHYLLGKSAAGPKIRKLGR